MTAPTPATLDTIERVFACLDYAALGAIYCHDDGADFWDDRREEVMRAGVEWAQALAGRLGAGRPGIGRPGMGRSLYVGAGVAELPALLTECLDLGREVQIASLNAPECESLNASLGDLGLSDRICFECLDAKGAAVEGAFDHLSLVSVLNDPEHYPTVSDMSYGRLHPVLMDVAMFEAERERLRALTDVLLGALKLPGWVTTTVEEVPWLMAAADARGLSVEGDDEVIETALVGDPLGFLRISAR